MRLPIAVTIDETGIYLNGIPVELPATKNNIAEVLNEDYVTRKLKLATVYTWDELGITAHETDHVITSLGFTINHDSTYKYTPREWFAGTITINAIPLAQLPITKKRAIEDFFTLTVGAASLFVSVDEKDAITYLEISKHVPKVIPEPDKYQFKPIAGKKIPFKDFNFKLAIIQVLMYEQHVLTPVFDVHEFAERYQTRAIDVDSEGDEIIPEVKAYFEALEIDQQHAEAVTEIYQDGGNDIYMNVIPFWSGETDDFNILSFEDVAHFPNLKKITLFYDERLEEIQAALRAKGIDVEPL
ncbi:MAG: hypothetical protein C0523_07915 [Cytophaga sp.]|nr:hypothetical protein [Cytophaga sp.]